MQQILFLFPTAYMAADARDVLGKQYPDIRIEHCPPQSAPALVPKHRAKGVGIIAARGGIAHALRESNVGLPLVDIPITAFDIIKAISEAQLLGRNIAILAHAQMVPGIDFLASVLGGAVSQYSVSYNQDYDKAVHEAVTNGAKVIVGGALACEAAQRHNVPHSVLRFSKESLMQAAEEAKRMQEALEADSARRDTFQTVMNSSRDGILIVNAAGTVTAANKAAEQFCNIKHLMGEDIYAVLPQLRRSKGKHSAIEAGQSLVSINKNSLVCDTVPIRRNNTVYGSVLTLQQTSRIQKMEAMIRQGLYSRGHVARFRFTDVIGESQPMQNAISLAVDYAETNSSILILGETGTGKEVFAQSIHNASKRACRPFVAVNCAAIPTQLLESELFGYVGGAFTGASKEGKPGLFEVAHGGTIFLDEMAEMDYANQGRLLRFYQERTVVRLGSYKVIPVDVRVIVATNKNLEEFVRANKFRDDLYHRLNVLRLELPPLRQRRSDVKLYAEAFLRRFAEESGKSLRLTREAIKTLEDYSWPGNIRECRNIMERAVACLKNGAVTDAMLKEMIGPHLAPAQSNAPKAKRMQEEIINALKASSGNHGDAAQRLGVNRTTLYRRMKRLHMEY